MIDPTNIAQHGSLLAFAGALVLALIWFILWLVKGLIMHVFAQWAIRQADRRWRKNAKQWGRPDEWVEPDPDE